MQFLARFLVFLPISKDTYKIHGDISVYHFTEQTVIKYLIESLTGVEKATVDFGTLLYKVTSSLFSTKIA